jgi:YYY domain-containing protein
VAVLCLSAVLCLCEVRRVYADDPPEEVEGKPTLLLDRPVGELPVVADFAWNRWASESTVGATALWWLVIACLGWLAWPLTFTVFRGLHDRGYLLSRSVALIVIGYLIWLPASLHWLRNGPALTYAAIGVLALVSGLLQWQKRGEMAAFLRQKRGVLILGEAIFGAAYLVFVGIRILNPDLWQPWRGGEKAMDIAYLNACLRSAYFPPYDPYFAHGYLNYYYYGQLLMSILVRLTGIGVTVSFNLAVPTLFALTVCNAFSIGYTLAGGVLGSARSDDTSMRFGISHGLLAVLCVTVLGNLASATQVIEHLGTVSKSAFSSQIPGLETLVKAGSGAGEILLHGARLPGFDYWGPSRVIGSTINEFPYWSFLFADLHPHMMGIPFTLLVIALALNRLRRKGGGQTGWAEPIQWVVWAVALGALWAINSWDWPAYAGLSGLVLLIASVQTRGKRGIAPALLAGVALAASSLVLYLPFIWRYVTIHIGFGWGLGRGHTPPGEFLTVWGLDLFLAISLLSVLLARQRSRWFVLRLVRLVGRYPLRLRRGSRLFAMLARGDHTGRCLSLWGGGLVLGLGVWWAWKGYWVLALMVSLLALVTALLVQTRMTDERRFALTLVFTSFLLIVGVELFYVKDHLDGGDAWRMNTLFKFYLQAWVVFGVALGATLPEIWQASERWRWGWRWCWTAALGVLLVAASLFVVLGTPARLLDRLPGNRPRIGTLDGLAFMTVGAYWLDEDTEIHLGGDRDAIRWLEENVRGTPVLAEAPVWYYRDFGGKVASYTGLPTLYNETHQGEQRYNWQTDHRRDLAHELFDTADPTRTVDIIRELKVAYVYVGSLERALYPQATGKFDQLAGRKLLSVVYRNESVRVYRVDWESVEEFVSF